MRFLRLSLALATVLTSLGGAAGCRGLSRAASPDMPGLSDAADVPDDAFDAADGDVPAPDLPDTPDAPDTALVTHDVPRPASARTEPWRPQVHFSPAAGWINDPVGLVFADGEYHLFLQANPDVPFWGDLRWGHAVGADRLQWTDLPPALAPDDVLGMPYSGSGIVVDGTAPPACAAAGGAPDRCLAVVFTHHGGSDGTEKQSLAVSADKGRTWTLHPRSPVLREAGLKDFRDPKVFRIADGYVLVAAAGDRARFYRSPDLLDWTPSGTFGPVAGLEGTWECPDLFELPIDGDPSRTAWVFKIDTNRGLGAARPEAWVFTGAFDGAAFVADGHGPRTVDAGPDFYAAQSWSNAPDGRRTVIAWMDHWSYALITPTEAWRGALTLPRDVRVVDRGGVPVVVQSPVDLSPLDLGVAARADRIVVEGATALPATIGAPPLDITIRLESGTWTRAGLRLFVPAGAAAGGAPRVEAPDGGALVGYDRAAGQVFVDRSGAVGKGVDRLFAGRFAAARPPDADGSVTIRVVVDRSSIEVFSGDATITALAFPDPSADGVGLFAEGGPATIAPLDVRALGTIWPAP